MTSFHISSIGLPHWLPVKQRNTMKRARKSSLESYFLLAFANCRTLSESPLISKHWFHHPINGDNTTNLRGLFPKAQGQSSIKDRKLTFTEHFQWTRHCDGEHTHTALWGRATDLISSMKSQTQNGREVPTVNSG